MNLEQATEAACHGFVVGRSVFGEFLVEPRGGGIWVAKDGPGRKGASRTAEIFTTLGADETFERMAGAWPAKFVLSSVRPPSLPREEQRDEFKRIGFRLSLTEPLFVRSDNKPPVFQLPTGLVVSHDSSHLAAVNRAKGRKVALPEQLSGPNQQVRLYTAFKKNDVAGWVKSVQTGFNANWVSDLFVLPEHRRTGVGAALMGAMLVGDYAAGVQHSVLLSSDAGSKLYPQLGYEDVGRLLMFNPTKELLRRLSIA